MILVDTSVWIDFFDHPASIYAIELKDLIKKDTDICLSEIIFTEILQGIKDDKIFEEIKDYLINFPIFKARGLETYIQAADIYRLCRKKGKSISKTVDALIAVIAIENHLLLFHKDKDFDLISSYTGLKIYKPN